MTPDNDAADRARFERWISAPPFERRTRRYGDDDAAHAWPRQYVDSDVDLAWRAWLAALRRDVPP